MGIMAWTAAALRLPAEPYKPVDERFAALLHKVASGELDKEEAWRMWLEIKAKDTSEVSP